MKSESFFKGTLILVTANAISKILGAILKIPLTYILGEQGMAIYQTAFSVYIMLLSFASSGLPLALSRYTAEQLALKNRGNVRYAMRISVLIMSVLGLILSLIMFFGSGFFAFSMKDPKAQLAISAISPSIFLVALGAGYKSCYQGYAHQTPTAVSQVIEALIKLMAGFSLAYCFSAFSVKYSSAAAIFGVSIGEFFATLILILLFVPYRRDLSGTAPEAPKRRIVSSLTAVALPLTLISLVSGGLSLLETSILRNLLTTIRFSPEAAAEFTSRYSGYTHLFDSLKETGRLSFDGARWLFGAYSGYASTVFNLPAGILASFGVSILPVVTGAVALKNHARLNSVTSGAAKTILVIALPAACMLLLFPADILGILFKNTASKSMLAAMAPLLLITVLCQLLGAIWHAAGDIYRPFRYGLLTSAVRIVLSCVLVLIPRLNITGAIISHTIAGALHLALNLYGMKKQLKITPVSFSFLLRAVASACIFGAVMLLLRPVAYSVIHIRLIAFISCAFIAVLAYGAALFVTGAVKKEDITQFKR